LELGEQNKSYLFMKKLLFSLALLAMIGFNSCTKEGKQGEQGIAGINGTNGTDGTNGTNGVDGQQGIPGINGNANVRSATFHVYTSSWTLAAPKYYKIISYGYITQDILDNGAVLVYMQDASGSWYATPFILYYTGYSTEIYQIIKVGQVVITVMDSDLTQTSNPGDMIFKIVVIAGSAKSLHKNIDYNNYNEVKKTFNLTD
jgi:hypothetical protein